MLIILQTEWLKLKRTPVRWLVFGAPFLYTILFLWYFSHRQYEFSLELAMFSAFFQVWTAVVIPFGAGLLTGLVTHQEEVAGNFWNLLSNRTARTCLYGGKLLMLLALSSTSTFLASVYFLFGVKALLQFPISVPIYLLAALLASVATFPLLAFHLWLSLAFGTGPCIGFGAVGILLAALMATNLGDLIWYYIPWAWPVRLMVLPALRLLNAAEFAVGARLPLAMLFFILAVWGGGVLWFKKWEGRRTS